MSTYPLATNLILACHITGIYDVNRNTVLPDDDFSLVKEWAQSVEACNLTGIVFHNNFSQITCTAFKSKNIRFIKITADANFNPNVYRYFIYRNFLEQTTLKIHNLFITDITDVVVLNNPFIEPIFTANTNALFCGDEPTSLNNEWMKAHGEHLRKNIADYAAYEEKFKNSVLLNCGIAGGNVLIMKDFIENLCLLHQQYNRNNKTAYTGDMGTFNYLLRTKYNHQIVHGVPVNTLFKAYQNDRTDCWFKHK